MFQKDMSNVVNKLTLKTESKALINPIRDLKPFITLSLKFKLLKIGNDKIPFTIQYTSI